MTPAGLEPAIPGSVGRCLIHWATGPVGPCCCQQLTTCCSALQSFSLGENPFQTPGHQPKTSALSFVKLADKKCEGREIRTPNLLIWSQTRYRCAIPPLVCNRPRGIMLLQFGVSGKERPFGDHVLGASPVTSLVFPLLRPRACIPRPHLANSAPTSFR